MMRNRLIESRLTPNAISLTGFALNLVAAGLIVGRMFFLAGIAFIVGSIMDTLDGRYSRMSGKGTQFGAFLDSTLDHGHVVVHGHTIVPEPVFRPNRIDIDTGAYASGRLTCLALEGTKRRILATGAWVLRGWRDPETFSQFQSMMTMASSFAGRSRRQYCFRWPALFPGSG